MFLHLNALNKCLNKLSSVKVPREPWALGVDKWKFILTVSVLMGILLWLWEVFQHTPDLSLIHI